MNNLTTPYAEFVKTALRGGTYVAFTLDQAKFIADDARAPIVIKLLSQFAGKHRKHFLSFATDVESRGIWLICGHAKFLEAKPIDSKDGL